ncbi:MAG: rod shape-determining protein MreC [Acidobacteriota bacterium]
MNQRFASVVVVLLLLAQTVLLYGQAEARGGRLEAALLGGLAPVARSVAFARGGTLGFIESLKMAGALRRDKERLSRRVLELESEVARLHGVEQELERLARLAAYRRPTIGSFVGDVVFADADSYLRTIIVWAGSEQPSGQQAVVTEDGLVGRVVVATGNYAKVQLVTDVTSAASAMVERTRRQGIARGAGDRGLLLDNLPMQSDVLVGDRVVTAGLDGVFPRGIPIGTVREVADRSGLFKHVELAPAVDFGVLEKVYLLSDAPLAEDVRDALVEREPGPVGAVERPSRGSGLAAPAPDESIPDVDTPADGDRASGSPAGSGTAP